MSAASYIWVHIRGQALWDDRNKAVRMSGSMNDITDRRVMIEQLRDSNEALSRFAYVCSHDLKEPARLAQNFASLLQDTHGDKLDADGQDYVQHIIDSTNRMNDMISGMLAYSQIENNTTPLENVDCGVEVEKVLQNLSLMIDEKKAKVSCSDLPVIKGDRMQIFQLLQNLIGNSLKFNTAKTPKVHVDVKDEGDYYRFSVKDNGIGMKAEYLHQIFSVFQRLNNTDVYPGTGIGLSICEKIVQRHGGKIWVDSIYGKGSTFYFTIPRHLSRKQPHEFIAA